MKEYGKKEWMKLSRMTEWEENKNSEWLKDRQIKEFVKFDKKK